MPAIRGRDTYPDTGRRPGRKLRATHDASKNPGSCESHIQMLPEHTQDRQAQLPHCSPTGSSPTPLHPVPENDDSVVLDQRKRGYCLHSDTSVPPLYGSSVQAAPLYRTLAIPSLLFPSQNFQEILENLYTGQLPFLTPPLPGIHEQFAQGAKNHTRARSGGPSSLTGQVMHREFLIGKTASH